MSASKQPKVLDSSVAHTTNTKLNQSEISSEDSGLEEIIDIEIDRIKMQK